MGQVLEITTTCPDRETATTLAEALVSNRLAACVQVSDSITSVYQWQGKIEQSTEYRLVIKSLDSLYERIEAFILDKHSYDVPEVLAVRVERASESYLQWLQGELEG